MYKFLYMFFIILIITPYIACSDLVSIVESKKRTLLNNAKTVDLTTKEEKIKEEKIKEEKIKEEKIKEEKIKEEKIKEEKIKEEKIKEEKIKEEKIKEEKIEEKEKIIHNEMNKILSAIFLKTTILQKPQMLLKVSGLDPGKKAKMLSKIKMITDLSIISDKIEKMGNFDYILDNFDTITDDVANNDSINTKEAFLAKIDEIVLKTQSYVSKESSLGNLFSGFSWFNSSSTPKKVATAVKVPAKNATISAV